ncbi:hypothetical protein HYQ09_gp175 [Acinetobacter phage vB_AbaM_Konradin]|uniref:Uncharacterized protein n=2 Tax=Lazarusvirus TaxID=2842820 RepID=A0A650EW48_9CAUD|nr:hypothetical protein HYQ09_gp175 [Acinetobacter phage vB_AbaM_Konradin]YP_009886987.1 hypothetical protein HYQ23_gp174 [Acinetobacter phage vB_AbaM_Lazarus]QGT53979.1 hypothetical protein Konradin_216 [Acinetobacter phage vB_AbaM_Konradin]QHJ74150.1 hypothetical protein Lazarus_215 [Acinetobacter phage vB_AbaM_Lazarus]
MKVNQVLRTYQGFWNPVNNHSVVSEDYSALYKLCDAAAYNGRSYLILQQSELPMYMFGDVESLVTFTQTEQEICDFRRRLLINMFSNNGFKIAVDDEYKQLKIWWV